MNKGSMDLQERKEAILRQLRQARTSGQNLRTTLLSCIKTEQCKEDETKEEPRLKEKLLGETKEREVLEIYLAACTAGVCSFECEDVKELTGYIVKASYIAIQAMLCVLTPEEEWTANQQFIALIRLTTQQKDLEESILLDPAINEPGYSDQEKLGWVARGRIASFYGELTAVVPDRRGVDAVVKYMERKTFPEPYKSGFNSEQKADLVVNFLISRFLEEGDKHCFKVGDEEWCGTTWAKLILPEKEVDEERSRRPSASNKAASTSASLASARVGLPKEQARKGSKKTEEEYKRRQHE